MLGGRTPSTCNKSNIAWSHRRHNKKLGEPLTFSDKWVGAGAYVCPTHRLSATAEVDEDEADLEDEDDAWRCARALLLLSCSLAVDGWWRVAFGLRVLARSVMG